MNNRIPSHILILDNSPRRLGTHWFSNWFRQLGCQVSAYHFLKRVRPIALDKFNALVITGSPVSATEDAPWILAELKLIEQAERRAMPVLGVCFGSQLLARAYYGQEAIRRAPQPEIGWYPINKTEQEDPLFAGVPKQFTSFQFHLEEILPQPGMQVLATSAATAVQAFRAGSKSVWGTQFHFEVTPRAGRDMLRKTRKVYEPYGFQYEEMVAKAKPCGAALQLFENFLKKIKKPG